MSVKETSECNRLAALLVAAYGGPFLCLIKGWHTHFAYLARLELNSAIDLQDAEEVLQSVFVLNWIFYKRVL